VNDLKAVIFDYYETLGELSPSTREGLFDDLASRVGVDLAPGEAYRNWRELTVGDMKLRLGGQRAPLDGPTAPFRTFRSVWVERSRQLFEQWGVEAPAEVGGDAYVGIHAGAPVYGEVPRTLESLRSRYRLAVLSDADNDFLEASIRRNGLALETVIASEEMCVYKPHVRMFREVCSRIGIEPSQAVYVGDSPWADIEGARHAGMRAVWVNRHGASWPDEFDPPEAVVTCLAELPGVLEVLHRSMASCD
jgi:2-haloalkanoic acid dehalogenase type II